MNKSLCLLLLVLVLLTARTEMNRPQDPIQTPDKEMTIQAKPGRHSGQVYEVHNNLSMRGADKTREPR
jgi:hypothetical protein